MGLLRGFSRKDCSLENSGVYTFFRQALIHLTNRVCYIVVLLFDLLEGAVPGLGDQPLLKGVFLDLGLKTPSKLPHTVFQPHLYFPPLLQEPLVDKIDPCEPLDLHKPSTGFLGFADCFAQQIDEVDILFHLRLHCRDGLVIRLETLSFSPGRASLFL